MDSEAAARDLGVKPEVLEALFNSIPFRDSYDTIISTGNSDLFWDYVDSLPRTISMKLHALELRFDVQTDEFSQETLSPVLESFWAAHLGSKGLVPETINPRAITSVSRDFIEDLLSQTSGWSKEGDNQAKFENRIFNIDALTLMCDCALSDGRSYLFCDIPELRAAYSALAKVAEHLDPKYHYTQSQISRKLRRLGYSNTDSMIRDMKGLECPELPQFEISETLQTALIAILDSAKDVYLSPGKGPEIGPVNSWIETRAEALVQQMSLPLQQRNAFIITPEVLQARSGMSEEAKFEPLSLVELLFSDSTGEAHPMPFANRRVELPVVSPLTSCRAVVRRFVAMVLLKTGYTTASDPVLDILTEVVEREIKRVSQTAVVIRKSSGQDDRTCLEHALKTCNYDVFANSDDVN